MATLTELRTLFADDTLRNKVEAAVIVKATAIVKASPAPSAGQRAYAYGILESPHGPARAVFLYILGDSTSASVAQIQGATDASIQTKVDAAMDVLKGA